MKICDTCGKALPDQTKFCPNCGTPIHDPPPFVSQQDTLGSIIQFEPPHQSAPSPEQKQTYYGQPHPGYPPIAPAYVPQQTQSNGKSVASLILGVLSLIMPAIGLLFAIIGLCLAISARRESNQQQPYAYAGNDRGLAKAGMVCSIIGIFLSILSAIYFFVCFAVIFASV